MLIRAGDLCKSFLFRRALTTILLGATAAYVNGRARPDRDRTTGAHMTTCCPDTAITGYGYGLINARSFVKRNLRPLVTEPNRDCNGGIVVIFLLSCMYVFVIFFFRFIGFT